jgi:hypothetical protein
MLRSSKNKTLAIILAAAGMGVTALAAYVHFAPKATAPASEPGARVESAPIVVPKPSQPSPAAPTVVTVYVPHMGANGIAFDTRPTALPEGAEPKMFAVREFLKASEIVGPEVHLLGINVQDGVAHLAFNHEFDRGYGTFEEKSLLDGFAAALGQFPEILSYKLEIDGRDLKTIGSVSLDEPVPVIRPADINRPEPNPAPTPTDLPQTGGPSNGPATEQRATGTAPSQPSSPGQESTSTTPKTGLGPH